jgi:hypothetical protein
MDEEIALSFRTVLGRANRASQVAATFLNKMLKRFPILDGIAGNEGGKLRLGVFVQHLVSLAYTMIKSLLCQKEQRYALKEWELVF